MGHRRRQLGFRTASLVGRFDLAPTIAMPLQWRGWSMRAAVTLRDTAYTQTMNPEQTLAFVNQQQETWLPILEKISAK